MRRTPLTLHEDFTTTAAAGHTAMAAIAPGAAPSAMADHHPARRASDARLRADHRARRPQRRPLEAEPGAIYPALGKLEDRGLDHVHRAGRQAQYELTEEGRTSPPSSVKRSDGAPWDELELGGHGDLRRALAELVGPARQIGRFGTATQTEAASDVIKDATAKLYKILADGPAEDSRPNPFMSSRHPYRRLTRHDGSSRGALPLRKSIDRVTVAATNRSSFGAAMNRAVASSGSDDPIRTASCGGGHARLHRVGVDDEGRRAVEQRLALQRLAVGAQVVGARLDLVPPRDAVCHS